MTIFYSGEAKEMMAVTKKAIAEVIIKYNPEGKQKGIVMVLSDSRLLNDMHGQIFSSLGYAVYTGITLTDILEILRLCKSVTIDILVIASKIYGWHGRHGEKRPHDKNIISPDEEWEKGNIATAVKIIRERQGEPVFVAIAYDLVHSPWYKVTKRGLTELGLEFGKDYHTYFASNPYTVIEHFEKSQKSKKGLRRR